MRDGAKNEQSEIFYDVRMPSEQEFNNSYIFKF